MADLRLPPVNVIIRDTLRARLAALRPGGTEGSGDANSVPPPPPVLALSLHEFDDVRYLLTADAATPARVALSLALPGDPAGARGTAALPEGAAAACASSYAPYATLALAPEEGYALTLLVDLAAFPAAQEEADGEAERVASLRSIVMGAPLRALLAPLAAGTPAPDTLVAITHRRVPRAAAARRGLRVLRSAARSGGNPGARGALRRVRAADRARHSSPSAPTTTRSPSSTPCASKTPTTVRLACSVFCSRTRSDTRALLCCVVQPPSRAPSWRSSRKLVAPRR